MDGARLRIGVAHVSTAKGQAGAASESFVYLSTELVECVC